MLEQTYGPTHEILALIPYTGPCSAVSNVTANPGVVSLISAWSHTFVEIDHEIVSAAILLPTADSRRVVVSYK